MQWFMKLLSKLQRKKLSQHQSEVAQRYTPLKLSVGSSISIDTTLLSFVDQELCAPIPFSELQHLSVKSITTQRVYDTTRWVVEFNECMPDTGFQIQADFIAETSSLTLWLTVDRFFMSSSEQWRDTIAEHTQPSVVLGEDEDSKQYDLSYYVEKVATLDYKGPGSNGDKYDHECVWKRQVPSLSGDELFRKVIVNDSKQEIAFGFEFNFAQVTVNY